MQALERKNRQTREMRKMPTRKEVIDQLDDDLKEILTDVDATKAWVRVASRIADALEHSTISAVLTQLGIMGFKVQNMPKPAHLASCPACLIVKSAQPPSDIANPNGISIIGRKG